MTMRDDDIIIIDRFTTSRNREGEKIRHASAATAHRSVIIAEN